MYPDWPESDADLIPLPRCDGPKLKPFDFQGPQKIEFLDYIGTGFHSHVYKVKILGEIYALKLFRFLHHEEWLAQNLGNSFEDREKISAFYHYDDPFSCECRAYGRLQESGYEDLAVKCFGYILLDEEHERAMKNQFEYWQTDFDGPPDESIYGGLREFEFLGKGGKEVPVRGIVKQFGEGVDEPNFRASHARKLLRDISKLQQLGIVHIDPGIRQLIDGKIGDLSSACTTPHYILTPEINPHHSPEEASFLNFLAFRLALNDYLRFDEEVKYWNSRYSKEKGIIQVSAFAEWNGCQVKYGLRHATTRNLPYTFVDPRKYDWKKNLETSSGEVRATRHPRRLSPMPPRWYYDCHGELAARLKGDRVTTTMWIFWDLKDGYLHPKFPENWQNPPPREGCSSRELINL